MTAPTNDGARSLGALLRDLAEEGTALVRQEIRLARIELGGAVRGASTGSALVAGGAVMALLGTLSLLTGIIMLSGDQWLRDQYWLAALIVFAIAGALAAWMARRGTRLLSPTRLVPDETIETLKEDKEWLKRQLTSDATSR